MLNLFIFILNLFYYISLNIFSYFIYLLNIFNIIKKKLKRKLLNDNYKILKDIIHFSIKKD